MDLVIPIESNNLHFNKQHAFEFYNAIRKWMIK